MWPILGLRCVGLESNTIYPQSFHQKGQCQTELFGEAQREDNNKNRVNENVEMR